MLFGCIGDDLTGSGDLSNNFAEQGMGVTQNAGVPNEPTDKDFEANVMVLSIQSIALQDTIKH